MGRQVGLSEQPPTPPPTPDNLSGASRGCYRPYLGRGATLGLDGEGPVEGPTQGPLGLPISRRWRFIIWEVAFFCFLCHEHMEVNLDLSPWPKKDLGAEG